MCRNNYISKSRSKKALDINIIRNYYGSHNSSFIDNNTMNNNNIKGIFIRAPKIDKLKSHDIIILSRNSKNEITGIKQNNVIGFTFHPELSEDFGIYKYFISLHKKIICED